MSPSCAPLLTVLAALLCACGTAPALADGGTQRELPDGGSRASDPGTPDDGGLSPDAGIPVPDGGVHDGGIIVGGQRGKIPCADPAVVSEKNLDQVFHVYCTGMAHAWRTSDFVTYVDEGNSLTFDLSSAPANSQKRGAWWAPGVYWDGASQQYVMWVSVLDSGAWSEMTRSLAVLTSPGPLGPWKWHAYGIKAAANGENEIDPFVVQAKDGGVYLYWKRYGGKVTSSIMGAQLDPHALTLAAGTPVEIMHGYNNAGWELNVRENPAPWQDPKTGYWHLLYSGAHWADDSYATGHAVSHCGPLCVDASQGGWTLTSSGDRSTAQVAQCKGNKAYAHGGIGGAVWTARDGSSMLVSAAANSPAGDTTRYLAHVALSWKNDAPYVDATGHTPPPSAFGF